MLKRFIVEEAFRDGMSQTIRIPAERKSRVVLPRQGSYISGFLPPPFL
jgi:hypothetical protein